LALGALPASSGPLEPWQRFERSRAMEAGQAKGRRVPFFDLSSTKERGRFRVHDARGFEVDSMRRLPLPGQAGGQAGGDEAPGVVLLLGRRPGDHPDCPGAEQVVTVMFDLAAPGGGPDAAVGAAIGNEAAAEAWWHRHKSALVAPDPV